MLSFFITFLLSIISVILFHSLWEYLKDNYSTKKTKDLVSIQLKKYDKIIDVLESNKNNSFSDNIPENDIKKLNDNLDEFINTQVPDTTL
tara:strand:- start:1097 stop:1366 length:270 start_codon:yes stop_codon:yes gene_type:complete